MLKRHVKYNRIGIKHNGSRKKLGLDVGVANFLTINTLEGQKHNAQPAGQSAIFFIIKM